MPGMPDSSHGDQILAKLDLQQNSNYHPPMGTKPMSPMPSTTTMAGMPYHVMDTTATSTSTMSTAMKHDMMGSMMHVDDKNPLGKIFSCCVQQRIFFLNFYIIYLAIVGLVECLKLTPTAKEAFEIIINEVCTSRMADFSGRLILNKCTKCETNVASINVFTVLRILSRRH